MKTAFNSKACPVSAAIVKAYREGFGEDVRVLAVRENGFEHDPEKRLTEREKRNANEQGGEFNPR